MTVPAPSVRSLLLLVILTLVQSASAAPAVVTSIRPLQFIALDLMEGIGTPVLLNTQGADPHHMNLRVSERRLLDDAELLLWIGPELEQPLAELSGQLNARQLAASGLPGLRLIPGDSHLWLDPANGLMIGEALAGALIEIDPANADGYRRNLQAFRQGVQETEAALHELLDGKTRPFAVYHNAFSYFETRFGFSHTLSLVGNEALRAGARQLRELQKEAGSGNLACMLLEPDVNPAQLETITGEYSLALIINDPLGAGIDAESNHYPALLQAVGTSFASCFSGGQP